mgnify:CR=1 FL=1
MWPTSLTQRLRSPKPYTYSGAASEQDTNPGTDDQEKGALAMKKMPVIFDLHFNEEGDREVMHTIREEIRDLVNKTLTDGGSIVPTFKRDGTAVFCDCLLYTSPSPRDRG